LLIAHMIMGAIRCGSGFPIATPTCQSCVQSSDSYPDKTQVGLPVVISLPSQDLNFVRKEVKVFMEDSQNF